MRVVAANNKPDAQNRQYSRRCRWYVIRQLYHGPGACTVQNRRQGIIADICVNAEE